MMRTQSELLSLHKNLIAQNQAQIERDARSGDSQTYYNLSYILHGLLSAVEGTGDEDLLRAAIAPMHAMIERAVETKRPGGTFKVWRQKNKIGNLILDSLGRPNQLSTFQGASPLARCAAIINRNPQWKEQFAVDAQRFFEFVDRNLITFYFDQEHGEYKGRIPWLNMTWRDMLSWTGIIASYLTHASQDETKRAVYFSLATQIANEFATKLQPFGPGWIWEAGTLDYDLERNTTRTPDTSHANREPMMLIAMHEASSADFDFAGIARMARTLTDTLWNQSFSDPAFANYIDGGNQPYGAATKAYSNGLIYAGWAYLARYDFKARQVCEAALDVALQEKNKNFALSHLHQSAHGRIALSGHLLRVGMSTLAYEKTTQAA
jgi:hypothetical protein